MIAADKLHLNAEQQPSTGDISISVQLQNIHDSQRSRSCRAVIDEGDEHTMEVEAAGSGTNVSVAMICHEIRSPIGALQNGIALVGSASLDFEGLARISEMMQRQLAQVVRLLDDLGDGVCLTSRKLRIKSEPVDLAKVSLHALDTIDRLIDDRRQELSIALPAAGTVWVCGDHVRLIEVVVNLLENASKYTATGGRILLEVKADSGTATLTVRDSGMGIPKDFIPRIFELFSQGASLPGVIERGLGLGLPMVRNLVRLHGGEVSVYSAGEGQGSEFRVSLPRLAHSVTVEESLPDKPAPLRTPPRRILIVDDVADASESLAFLLRAQGHETRTAADGPAALEVADAFRPEFALLDLGLPGMDGYELARKLRKEMPKAKLIAVTGYRKDAERLGQAGYDYHLIKPVHIDTLMGLLAGDGQQPETAYETVGVGSRNSEASGNGNCSLAASLLSEAL